MRYYTWYFSAGISYSEYVLWLLRCCALAQAGTCYNLQKSVASLQGVILALRTLSLYMASYHTIFIRINSGSDVRGLSSSSATTYSYRHCLGSTAAARYQYVCTAHSKIVVSQPTAATVVVMVCVPYCCIEGRSRQQPTTSREPTRNKSMHVRRTRTAGPVCTISEIRRNSDEPASSKRTISGQRTPRC